MFKYSTDPELIKSGFHITSFKPQAVFNDEQNSAAAVSLFKQLTDAEIIYHNHFDLEKVGQWTRDIIVNGLMKKERIYFIKNNEGKYVGMAVTGKSDFKDTLIVSAVVVDKKFRGRGLGKHLMKHIINDNVGKMLQLTVSAANPHGVELYKSLGFKVSDYRMVLK